MSKAWAVGDMVRTRGGAGPRTVGRVEWIVDGVPSVQILTGDVAGALVAVDPSRWFNMGPAKR